MQGADLVDFVRRRLYALVEAGAKPVIGGGGTDYYWIVQPQYGTSNAEIVENVIAEWLASRGRRPRPGRPVVRVARALSGENDALSK